MIVVIGILQVSGLNRLTKGQILVKEKKSQQYLAYRKFSANPMRRSAENTNRKDTSNIDFLKEE